jgi:hypothetical protein
MFSRFRVSSGVAGMTEESPLSISSKLPLGPEDHSLTLQALQIPSTKLKRIS